MTSGGLECRASGATKKEAKAEVARKMLTKLDSERKDSPEQAVTLTGDGKDPEMESSSGLQAGLDLERLTEDFNEFRQFLEWRQRNKTMLDSQAKDVVRESSSLEEREEESQTENGVGLLQELCMREGAGLPTYQELPGSYHGNFAVRCATGSLSSVGRGCSKVGFGWIRIRIFH